MSKAVLISIQPYWLFLIIATKMGWNIDKDKTIEVRKTFPKDENWNKVVKMYCSKDKKSFSKIPKEYQPLMKQFLGKVIGEFVCNEIIVAECGSYCNIPTEKSQIDVLDYLNYADQKTVYGWHISDLVIYDKPKKLSEFYVVDYEAVNQCEHRERIYNNPDFTNGAMLLGSYLCKDKTDWCTKCKTRPIKRPPQSWCYVEELSE